MTDIVRVAGLVFNQPHHIAPAAGEAIAAVIAHRMGKSIEFAGDRPEPRQDPWIGKPSYDKDQRYQGYRVTPNGVAIVSLKGELVNRGAWIGASSGLVSYEGLRQIAKNVGRDNKVRAVVTDTDSPGGQATGMTETAEVFRELAKTKPVIAVANGMIASAAYGVCSGATRIYTTPSSHLGSIGTLMMHLDRSGELEQRGWKVTFIHAGRHKVDGNSFQPLPAAVRDDLQRTCEQLQSMFVETVVAGRPMTEQQVRDTEARIFMGEEAVAVGLADQVGDFDAALADAASAHRKSFSVQLPTKETTMSQDAGTSASADYDQVMEAVALGAADALRQTLGISNPEQSTQAAVLASPPAQKSAEPTESPQDAHARGFSEATTRIRSILTHESAKGRGAQAQVLALETSMSVDDSVKVLAMMPTDQAAAGNNTTKLYDAVAAQGGNAQVPHQGHNGDRDVQGHQSTLGERMKQHVDRRFRTKEAS